MRSSYIASIFLLAVCVIVCPSLTYAKVNCGFVSSTGKVYSFQNLTWKTVGLPYRAVDGIHEYLLNICGPVSEDQCRANDGFACMYNTSGTTSMEGIIATNKDTPESAYWSEQDDGVKLSAYNGYYGAMRARVSVELRCDESVVVPPKTMDVNANYDIATFKFFMRTSAACSHSRAAFAVEPTLLSRTAVSDVAVTVTSLPPSDVSMRCESPYLVTGGFTVSFRGPESGSTATYIVHVKLVDNFDTNMESFPLICSLSGGNATLYQYPRSINFNVAPYHKGHTSLSGGSIFIIIVVVLAFFYILFGCLYRWRCHGTEVGMDSFPNIEFWRQFWQYTKDGWSYFFGTLLGIQACRSSSSSSYTEVNDTR